MRTGDEFLHNLTLNITLIIESKKLNLKKSTNMTI